MNSFNLALICSANLALICSVLWIMFCEVFLKDKIWRALSGLRKWLLHSSKIMAHHGSCVWWCIPSIWSSNFKLFPKERFWKFFDGTMTLEMIQWLNVLNESKLGKGIYHNILCVLCVDNSHTNSPNDCNQFVFSSFVISPLLEFLMFESMFIG